MSILSRILGKENVGGGPVISYVPFDELIVSLRHDGLIEEADALHELIYSIAWTTGSELIGELGQKMKEIERKDAGQMSRATKKKVEAAFEMVRRVWPKFPR